MGGVVKNRYVLPFHLLLLFTVFQVIAAGGAIGNIAFSPFGLMAVSVLLYEGSSGYSALQIKQSLNLPWEILAVRIGVRDLNRYLKVNNEIFVKLFFTEN